MSFVDEYIEARSVEDPEFSSEVNAEAAKLDAAVAFTDMRYALGLSQKQLGALAGKPQSTIARIENGSLNPTVGLLAEIAGSAGWTLEVRFAEKSPNDQAKRSRMRQRICRRIDTVLANDQALSA